MVDTIIDDWPEMLCSECEGVYGPSAPFDQKVADRYDARMARAKAEA